ncbi:cyclic nucleotide-binding domain-containing protein [Pelagibius sp. 7325]|uniref:Crp/Fnr family transcriptional regulator n=1 Tax=Pelagibius sp. 7325 TaxID=3131994 RepID=UPI0030EDD3E6
MRVFDFDRVSKLSPAVPRERTEASPCAACTVRGMTICAPLDNQELAQVSAIMTSVELTSGEPLFDEGEEAGNVYNVTSGTVKVYKLLPDGRRQVTGFLFPGDFVGLARQETYAFSAEAVTPCLLCRFPRSKLENLMQRMPKIEQRLLNIASNELVAAQEQMLLLGRKTAREKIASFLLMLSKRARQRGQADDPVMVPMSRTDIGDYLGLTTETVSRSFTQLKQDGVIQLLPNHQVKLAQREALEDIAGGF